MTTDIIRKDRRLYKEGRRTWAYLVCSHVLPRNLEAHLSFSVPGRKQKKNQYDNAACAPYISGQMTMKADAGKFGLLKTLLFETTRLLNRHTHVESEGYVTTNFFRINLGGRVNQGFDAQIPT